MTNVPSVLIIENQEPGDCATCPLFFRNAGVCSWTMRFDGDCPLQRALRKAWKPKQAEEKMKDRNCENCVHAKPFGGPNDNRCDAWECEYINRKEAIEAYKARRDNDKCGMEVVPPSGRTLCDFYVRDKTSGEIHKVGTDAHDSIWVDDKGTLYYQNLQNGDGCFFRSAKDDKQGYEFVPSDCGMIGE